MAKWGEGDPRWLVQERHDGVNVNGWHWEEKDRMVWAKERIAALLDGLQACSSTPVHADLKISKISKIDGEASVSMRKGGKKLAVFDLQLHIEWVGKARRDDAEEVTGTLKITEFSNHGDEDDLIVECTKTGTNADAMLIRRLSTGMASCQGASRKVKDDVLFGRPKPSIWSKRISVRQMVLFARVLRSKRAGTAAARRRILMQRRISIMSCVQWQDTVLNLWLPLIALTYNFYLIRFYKVPTIAKKG